MIDAIGQELKPGDIVSVWDGKMKRCIVISRNGDTHFRAYLFSKESGAVSDLTIYMFPRSAAVKIFEQR